MMPMLRRLTTLSLVGIGATLWSAGIKLDVVPAFDRAPSGSVPLYANLSNDGPDAQGVLVFDSESGPIEVPVELPQGSRKRVFVSPSNEMGRATVTLVSNRGVFRKQVSESLERAWGLTSVALISDAPGQLSLLQKSKDASQFFILDGSVDNAPPRMSGYRNIRAVVLSDGSERLDDSQVAALQSYARLGGTLILVGGAGSSVVDDPRWRSLLPVANPTVQVRPRGAWLGSVDSRGLPESLTVRAGPLRPGAETLATPILTFRPHGLGRVYYLAINPFESAYASWQGGGPLLLRALRYAQSSRAENYLSALVGGYSSDPMLTMPGASWTSISPRADPFQITLPSADRVGYVLLAYLVCVVPLNFLILKKMKKGEWAWITAPVLAVGFAGALFALAQDLYRADLSTGVRSVIAVSEDAPDGIAYARAQMFFPHGGSYDLRLGPTEYVDAPNSRYQAGFMGTGAPSTVPSVDDGERVSVPRLPVTNLAFREFTFVERVPGAGSWLVAQRRGNRITVTNRSPHRFLSIVANSARESGIGPALDPGQTQVIRMQPRPNNQNFSGGGSPVSGSGGVMVEALVSGVELGPRLGKAVPNSTSTHLVTIVGGTR